ncbi:hypothetical protein, partial [Moritella sp.]|uniref:hypothetical protein n=1 Tax=Moritella sp. TaxID=78556 RepID=UPI0025E6351F
SPSAKLERADISDDIGFFVSVIYDCGVIAVSLNGCSRVQADAYAVIQVFQTIKNQPTADFLYLELNNIKSIFLLSHMPK